MSPGFGLLPKRAARAQRALQSERSILFLLSSAATAAAQTEGPAFIEEGAWVKADEDRSPSGGRRRVGGSVAEGVSVRRRRVTKRVILVTEFPRRVRSRKCLR